MTITSLNIIIPTFKQNFQSSNVIKNQRPALLKCNVTISTLFSSNQQKQQLRQLFNYCDLPTYTYIHTNERIICIRHVNPLILTVILFRIYRCIHYVRPQIGLPKSSLFYCAGSQCNSFRKIRWLLNRHILLFRGYMLCLMQ